MTRKVRRDPLLRLLAVNLVAGVAVAVVAVGGLVLLDAFGLRRLIAADHSPLVPLAVLLFSFIVSFGSWVMGSAIMRIGKDG